MARDLWAAGVCRHNHGAEHHSSHPPCCVLTGAECKIHWFRSIWFFRKSIWSSKWWYFQERSRGIEATCLTGIFYAAFTPCAVRSEPPLRWHLRSGQFEHSRCSFYHSRNLFLIVIDADGCIQYACWLPDSLFPSCKSFEVPRPAQHGGSSQVLLRGQNCAWSLASEFPTSEGLSNDDWKLCSCGALCQTAGKGRVLDSKSRGDSQFGQRCLSGGRGLDKGRLWRLLVCARSCFWKVVRAQPYPIQSIQELMLTTGHFLPSSNTHSALLMQYMIYIYIYIYIFVLTTESLLVSMWQASSSWFHELTLDWICPGSCLYGFNRTSWSFGVED